MLPLVRIGLSGLSSAGAEMRYLAAMHQPILNRFFRPPGVRRCLLAGVLGMQLAGGVALAQGSPAGRGPLPPVAASALPLPAQQAVSAPAALPQVELRELLRSQQRAPAAAPMDAVPQAMSADQRQALREQLRDQGRELGRTQGKPPGKPQ